MITKNFWNKKRVLVTGHTGFKGGWLSLWLKELGAEVIGYSLNPISKNNFFDQAGIKKIFKRDYRKNIQNIYDLKKCINKHKPQIIFHLAAQPQVLQSYIEPLDTVRTNVLGTINLLEIAKEKKFVKSIVIITTDKVYKNVEKNIRFKEDSSLGGDDVYSSSKAAADLISLSYIKSFFNNSTCNVATARAGNCIGGGDWTKFRILTDSMHAFLNNKKLLIRNPKAKRPWQHVLEPLAGYILLAQKLYSKKGSKFNGAWNFGPKRQNHLNVLQFAKIVKLKLNTKSKILLKRKKDKKEKISLDLNSKKANKKLKWKPFLNIDQTLSLTTDWYLANKKKKNMFKFSIKQIKDFTNSFNKL
tara:strand:- start:13871 stop:14944 length:1074 start_codon:yes stop_codon:yes gene_type:complete